MRPTRRLSPRFGPQFAAGPSLPSCESPRGSVAVGSASHTRSYPYLWTHPGRVRCAGSPERIAAEAPAPVAVVLAAGRLAGTVLPCRGPPGGSVCRPWSGGPGPPGAGLVEATWATYWGGARRSGLSRTARCHSSWTVLRMPRSGPSSPYRGSPGSPLPRGPPDVSRARPVGATRDASGVLDRRSVPPSDGPTPVAVVHTVGRSSGPVTMRADRRELRVRSAAGRLG
jgi:hypothetical protein